MIGDGHPRKQNRIIPERGENHLINFILVALYDFSEVALAQDSVERLAVSRIVGAECCIPICEKSNACAVVAMLRRIVVQKLRRAFVLPYLDISVVRHGRNHTIVAHLVSVVSRSTPMLVDGRQGPGIS